MKFINPNNINYYLAKDLVIKFPNPLNFGDYGTELSEILEKCCDFLPYNTNVKAVLFFGSACRQDKIYKTHKIKYKCFGFNKTKTITKRVKYPNDIRRNVYC